MRRERMLLILGIWVAVLSHLGFPYFWSKILFTLSGLILIYFSYVIHKENKAKEVVKEKDFENFKESHNFNEEQI